MRSETDAALNTALPLVAELGAALTATTTLAELIAVMRTRLKWLLPVRSASLVILEEGGEQFHLYEAERDVTHHPLARDLFSWCLRRATGVEIDDLTDAAAYPPEVTPATSLGEGALMTIPLAASDRPLGLLVLRSRTLGAFRRQDHGLIHLIGLQVAAAVRVALLLDELDGAEAIISGMARAVEAKDAYTAGHSDRVTAYALRLAEAASLPFLIRSVIRRAGPLHDVGKIGIPDAVLRKPGKLDDEEYRIIQQHPVIGDEICRPLASLRKLRAGVRHHHERYDGRGYPDGLAGLDIPLEARVLAIADTFDAMTSSRPYRAGMPIIRAMSILAENDGPQWDPALIPIFCRLAFAIEPAAA